MSKHDGRLWAICSYFNPAGYRRRLQNFRRFRAALQVPLAVVELGFNGRHDLTPADADICLQIHDGDVLWQKERLLNLLLPRLPPVCEFVAWIDADVLLQDSAWPHKTIATLETAPLLQLYSSLRYLEPDGSIGNGQHCRSMAALIAAGTLAQTALARATVREGGAATVGMAWAARREVIARHGFYDACIIGGGDTALACAAWGVPEIAMALHHMNRHQSARYLEWASAFHRDVQAQVASLDGEIHHLWHGSIAERRAGQRHVDLAPHNFDPATDLAAGGDGAWRWASDKPELHKLLRDYFHGRNEDGAAEGA